MLVGVHSTNTVTVLQKVEQLAQVSELSVEKFQSHSQTILVWEQDIYLNNHFPHNLQDVSKREEEVSVQTSQIHQLQSEQRRLQEDLVQVSEALEQERATVKQLDGELVTVNLVKQGMNSEIEKVCVCRLFANHNSCVKSLK